MSVPLVLSHGSLTRLELYVCRTEENQEAHRINEQMSAEIVELTADVEQLEARAEGRRESEYQKVLVALSRQSDDGGAMDLLQQIKPANESRIITAE